VISGRADARASFTARLTPSPSRLQGPRSLNLSVPRPSAPGLIAAPSITGSGSIRLRPLPVVLCGSALRGGPIAAVLRGRILAAVLWVGVAASNPVDALIRSVLHAGSPGLFATVC